MTGFEPRTSGIGSDRSAKRATTTAQLFRNMFVSGGVVVAQLAERSLPTSEDLGSNPAIGNSFIELMYC